MHNKVKNRGLTLVELVLSMGILGIILMLIFPMISIFNKSRQIIMETSKRDNHKARVLELIEQNINRASLDEINFFWENFLQKGKGIYLYENENLSSEFLSQTKKNGNFILLKIPHYKKGKKEVRYISFKFDKEKLSIANYFPENLMLRKTREEILMENVQGKFVMEGFSIKIIITYLDKNIPNKIENISEGVGAIEKIQ